jgi:hypothetical protein
MSVLNARPWCFSTKASNLAGEFARAGMNGMDDRTFVDTNVLIYAHDVDAKAKRQAAQTVLRQLWSERTGVLGPQVLQEFMSRGRFRVRSPKSPPVWW